MSKASPRKKQPAARRTLPPPAASIAGATHEDEDASELVEDAALLSFVSTPALGADHLLVLALNPSGDAVIQNRQAQEARRIPEELTLSIAASCERHAAIEKRAVRFRASWMRNDKTLATYAWECGSGKAERELDGTVQSFLIDQQSNAREMHKLQIESFEMVQEGWKALHALQNKRIEALERENGELRDRLRKLDDVQTELAIEQMRVDLEQRGKTVDMVEKRLLPIVQAFAVKKLQESSPAAGSSEPKQSEHKQPAADA